MSGGITAYIDGGARGNPGPAGYGVRIERPDGTLIEEFSGSIGTATNNVAEYRGLIAALEWARAHGYKAVHIRSDSLLLIQQMLGNFKVKHPGLRPLHARARLLAHEIGRVTFEHVGRELNAHADRLANAAMDAVAARASPGATSRPAVGASPASVVQDSGPSTGSRQPTVTAHPLTAFDRAVRLFVYRHFVDTAGAPDVAAIAQATRADPDQVAFSLRRLADAHAIVLAPASIAIWMAHPFSAVPTAYPVVTGGCTYWANCAWDAAGVLSLVGVDGETRTRCSDCGEELTMSVRGGRMMGSGIVHFAVPPRNFWDNVAYT